MELFYFQNSQPSQYDGLGEIDWVTIPRCGEHGEIKPILTHQIYDGLDFYSPLCPICRDALLGVPVDKYERAILLKKIPERQKLSDEIDAMLAEREKTNDGK